jgi:hypothetical protein
MNKSPAIMRQDQVNREVSQHIYDEITLVHERLGKIDRGLSETKRKKTPNLIKVSPINNINADPGKHDYNDLAAKLNIIIKNIQRLEDILR